MNWNMEEAIAYYRSQGAPKDQNALINLLKEIQMEFGSIPNYALAQISIVYDLKESFLLAVIRRIPNLRVGDSHILELCAGPNCSKYVTLAEFAEKLQRDSNCKITLKFVPCMRMCGKGPNIKWDGKLYHKADEALLRNLQKE